MRYSEKTEEFILYQVLNHPDSHVRLPKEMYRTDGKVMTYRDNRQQMVHRRLWELVHQRPLARRMYLLKKCGVERCINPLHYEVSATPHAGQQLDTCPNGHRYTAENTLPRGSRDRCKKCKEDRLARRRKKDRARRAEERKQRGNEQHAHVGQRR
jgi:hypothetical protein